MPYTITRVQLPQVVNYNRRVWMPKFTDGIPEKPYIIVKVRARRLAGKVNLHGKPYGYSTFYFVPQQVPF
jgi:hypothetical protein